MSQDLIRKKEKESHLLLIISIWVTMLSIFVCRKSLALHLVITLTVCSYFWCEGEIEKTNSVMYLEIKQIFTAPRQFKDYPDLKANTYSFIAWINLSIKYLDQTTKTLSFFFMYCSLITVFLKRTCSSSAAHSYPMAFPDCS